MVGWENAVEGARSGKMVLDFFGLKGGGVGTDCARFGAWESGGLRDWRADVFAL